MAHVCTTVALLIRVTSCRIADNGDRRHLASKGVHKHAIDKTMSDQAESCPGTYFNMRSLYLELCDVALHEHWGRTVPSS